MSKKTTLLEKFIYFFEKSANARVAYELYALSDQQLENIGISREKLRLGADAWPWKVDVEQPVALDFSSTVNFKKKESVNADVHDEIGHDDHTHLAA